MHSTTANAVAAPSGALVHGLTLIAALGGLLFGYDTAVISGAVAAIDANFVTPRGLSETAAGWLSGTAISFALWGCAAGGLIAGPLSQRIGRRGGLLVSAVLFMVSSVGSAYPEIGMGGAGSMGVSALWPFIVYRFISGMGIGMASMLSPLYIAEIAPPAQRGHLVTYQQIAIVSGMVLVYFVNWAIAAQGDDRWVLSTGWRYMLLSGVIPAALFFLLLLAVPETPRWLVMKGRTDKALGILRRLGSEAEARQVLTEIEGSLSHVSTKLFAFGGLVVFVGIMLSVFQQLVGINAVLYFAPLMFNKMGLDTNASLLQTVIVGVANVVFTLVALVTVDRWGRKPLLVLGAAVMAISMLVLGTLFATNQYGTVALVVVIAYIGGFALSWGPVVWVLLAEIFPNAVKNKAMAIAVCAQWLANILVSTTFKVLIDNSWLNALFNHGFVYWVYGVMSVLAAFFVLRYVPETKGRTLEEINQLWVKRQ